jgi:hypothetical protein
VGGSGVASEQSRDEELEPPTQRFERSSGIVARSEIVPPSPFLLALGEVRSALEVLVATAHEACVTPALDAAIGSLVHVIGMWRTNLVRQVDELALGEDGELPSSSSLPEYSAAYTLAIVQPALKEAEACAVLERGEAGEGDVTDCVGLVQAVAVSVERTNATLRYRND